MKDQSKRSVCYICYRRFPDTNFEHYSHFVSENGYEVSVVAYREGDQKSFEILGKRKIYRVGLPGKSISRKSRAVFAMEVIKFLRRSSFSIVHIHHTCPFFLAYKILGNNGSKYIFHCTSYPIAESPFRSNVRMLKWFCQSLTMNRVIIQSEELRTKLIGMRSLDRTQVVPIGFNAKLFNPVDEIEKRRLRNFLNIPKDCILLAYCGAIGRRRELDRLLSAFSQIRQVREKTKMLFIGDGNYLEEAKSLAHLLNVEKDVIFLGRVPQYQVVRYLNASDIGLSYVPINENFNYNPPLKTFEYLACGLPTVATSTLSNRRIINEGYNGLLVEDKPDRIAKSVLDLLNNEALLNSLKSNSSISIKNFDFEIITKTQLLPMYAELFAQ